MKTAFYAMALIPICLAGCVTQPDTDLSVGAITPPQDVISERISYYARVYAVPESLIRRSIKRESNYDPTSHAGPYWGLMQIRYDTARGMGYRGPPRGLLDADTNLRYAVAYLSNAYLVAEGNPDRALALYAGGYFYEARRKGILDQLKTAPSEAAPPADVASQ